MIPYDSARRDETVEVTITLKVTAQIPYQMAVHESLGEGIRFGLDRALREIRKRGTDLRIEANEIKIDGTLVGELI